MIKVLKIGHALIEVDDDSKTYTYLDRNPTWEQLSDEENEQNKRHLYGYTRIIIIRGKADWKRFLKQYPDMPPINAKLK